MVKQCGSLVSKYMKDGSYDLKEGRLDYSCPIGRSMPPFLSISATDPLASEVGLETGTFTISRSGDTSQAITIDLVIGGTATSGIDYAPIANQVIMAAGVSEVTITVTPLGDDITDPAETVIVTLAPVTHSNYYIEVGSESATVTIEDSDIEVG